MSKIFAALGWLILFVAVFTGASAGLVLLLLHHAVAPGALASLSALSAVPGALAWVIALGFAALPGARRPPLAPARFGLAQGLWSIAGAALMLVCGTTLPWLAALFLYLLHRLRHLPAQLPGETDLSLLLASLLAGELLAALWLAWYVRRQGPAVLHDGGAAGIGWRPAPRAAYGLAVLGTLAIMVLAVVEFSLVPPDPTKLQNLPLTQLLQGPPIVAFPTMAVAILMAPILEEFLFRGVAFAGIAARLGPGWAVVITTITFTALHAEEKLAYPLGFADVAAFALLSCALRLRYRSIRPGIAMHFMYNFGLLLVPALMAGR